MNPALEDLDLEGNFRFAVAESDRLFNPGKRERHFKEKYGSERVITFPGNHCFNQKGDAYFGFEKDNPHRALYDDIKEFFAES